VDGGAIGQLIIVLVCLVLSGFASAAETSLTGVRRSRILQLAEETSNSRARLVAGLLGAPQRFLTTILVLNSVCVIVASSLATELCLRYIPPHPPWLPGVVSSVAMSLIVLICAEITPKLLAIQNTERAALRLGPVVNVFAIFLKPVIAILTWITGGLARLFGSQTTRLDQHYTEEELRMLVEVGEQQGVLEEEETAMIHGVFEFGDTLVREVMRPRIDVAAVAADAPFQDVIEVAMNAGHSRIPMFEESIDNIVGVLYVKDLLRFLLPDHQPINLRTLARPPFFVPESRKVTQVFHDMRTTKVHMAIVLDEYGGTAGVVTFESLIERIVGDAGGEFGGTARIVTRPDGSADIDGLALVADLNGQFGLHIDEETYNTVGGYVLGRLGRRARLGDTVDVEGRRMRVDQLDGLRVAKVWLSKPASPPAEHVEP
jgi:putative hemolysin